MAEAAAAEAAAVRFAAAAVVMRCANPEVEVATPTPREALPGCLTPAACLGRASDVAYMYFGVVAGLWGIAAAAADCLVKAGEGGFGDTATTAAVTA